MSATPLTPRLVAPSAAQRRAGLAGLLTGAALILLGIAAAAGTRPAIVGGVVAAGLLTTAVVVARPYLPWSRVLIALVLVILFIPLRRYKFPGDAGISLEPYRLLVALIVAGWAMALLCDARIRFRKSGIDGAIAFVLFAIVASDLANPGRVSPMQSEVIKSVTFILSFVIVFYLVVSVVRTTETIDRIVKTLVWGGAVIGFFAVVESRTGFSPFAYVDKVFPVLVGDPAFQSGLNRGSATRAVGPAEHPIALGAVLVMLVPLAVYVVRKFRGYWYVAFAALVIGVLSTVSRTGVLMLIVTLIVFFWLRPRQMKRVWPLLLPVIVLTQFAAPGTLGSLKQAFFPEGGLVSEQEALAGDCASSGRVADIGPTLDEVAKKPFTGYGFGTRIVTGEDSNACILDNQWLGTTYELGLMGFIAWLLFFVKVGRRFGKGAKEDESDEGWLQIAVTASVTAYAVGSFTFDSLGFSQVTFILFLALGLAAAARANADERRGPQAIALGRQPAGQRA
jgi:polysaccharide biosynthesis protein PslJ